MPIREIISGLLGVFYSEDISQFFTAIFLHLFNVMGQTDVVHT